MMKSIVLTECSDHLIITDDEAIYNGITQQQSDELAGFISDRRLKTKNIQWGNKTITFINYVGFIQLSTYSLEILPKVSVHDDQNERRKILLEMLNECGYIQVTPSNLGRLQMMGGSLLEVFGRIYVDALLPELKKGITSTYEQVENNLLTLKGSLIISKHIKENLSRNKRYMAYCEYEERITDHKLNQVLKAANTILLKKIKNVNTQKNIKQIDHYFDNVSLKSFSTIQLQQIKLDRTNKRFDIALLLAKQFLTDKTSTFSSGKQTSFSLLFEMNDLFEKYIAVLMKRTTSYTVQTQNRENYLFKKESNHREIFPLKPDIVVGDETNQIIVDTKWKPLTTGNRYGVKREDLYQMYAYLTRYEFAYVAILLYPKQLNLDLNYDEHLESWHLHGNEQKKLRVYAISLENKIQTMKELQEIISANGL